MSGVELSERFFKTRQQNMHGNEKVEQQRKNTVVVASLDNVM